MLVEGVSCVCCSVEAVSALRVGGCGFVGTYVFCVGGGAAPCLRSPVVLSWEEAAVLCPRVAGGGAAALYLWVDVRGSSGGLVGGGPSGE